jgi:hypothetical protein
MLSRTKKNPFKAAITTALNAGEVDEATKTKHENGN